MYKVKDVLKFLENKYPYSLASSFDQGKIGLQFGSREAIVSKVMIALDGTKDVIDEAISKKCDLLILHHPFMFNPLLNMDYDTPAGQKMLKVFDNRLNIIAMHTNFDVAIDGMNDILSSMLQLKNVKVIENVVKSESLMRVGEINPIPLKDFALVVKNTFDEKGIRVVGSLDKIISKVGIIGGGGAIYWKEALENNCDCYITGEIRHNNAIEALENDFALIEVSHSVEHHFKSYLQKELSVNFSTIEFVLATNDENPFKCL